MSLENKAEKGLVKKQPAWWWGVLGAVIILAAGYFLLLAPLVEQYFSLNKDLINNKTQELMDKEKVVKELEKLIALFETIEPAVQKRINIFLPASEDLPNLHYNFDKIVSGAGFKILAISLDTKQPLVAKENTPTETGAAGEVKATKKGLREIKVKFNLTGTSYVNLKNLAQTLENNLRVFNIESFDYNPEKATVEIILKTYYYN